MGTITVNLGSIAGKVSRSANLADLTDEAAARTNLGLGSAAQDPATDFATAAQGAKADSAVQSVFGRTGTVAAATGDYAIGQLSIGTDILVTRTSTQTFANGVEAPIAYNNITRDSLSEWNTSTFSFTAKNAGYYAVSSQSYVPSLASSQVNALVELSVNGDKVFRIFQNEMITATGLAMIAGGFSIIKLNANDVLAFMFEANYSGGSLVVGNFARTDYATIFRIA